MPSNYEYYLLGFHDAGESANGQPLSRWLFNIRYTEFLRAVSTLKTRTLSSLVTQDNPNILRYTGMTFLDELVWRGRKVYEATANAGRGTDAEGPPPPGSGPPPPPVGPDPSGSGDREPRNPREPVLVGAGARPLPRGDGQDERFDWRW